MKRVLSLFLILLLSGMCAACSGPEQAAVNSIQAAEPDDTSKRMTFEHVPVRITGYDILDERGYAVSDDLDALLKDVTLIADVPLRQVPYAKASVFDPCVDLSRITAEGEQEIAISCKSVDPDFGRVIRISPETIRINVVSKYFQKYADINAEYNDSETDDPGSDQIAVDTSVFTFHSDDE